MMLYVAQVWYADDACACGRLASLRQWWDQLCELGPGFGYSPTALKTWLVVKDRCHSEAEVIFAGTNVKITNEGRPVTKKSVRRQNRSGRTNFGSQNWSPLRKRKF